MDDNKFKAGIGVGTTMLILIFGILCLTVFATLALVSADNDKQLADKTEKMISAYYQADGEIEELLQIISGELKQLQNLSSDSKEYEERIKNMYQEAFDSETKSLEFVKIINEQLLINLVIVIDEYETGQGLFKVTERNIEAYNAFELDNSLNLWTGEKGD